MNTVVLRMTVSGEDLLLTSKFIVPPELGTRVAILPKEADYELPHKVVGVIADPFTGLINVRMEHSSEAPTSEKEVRFSLVLQSYGWTKAK